MTRILRNLTFALLAVAAGAFLLLRVPQAEGDDTDLLRTATADPYVFFMLDSSASMNADVDGNPLPANGDDPRSKIYIAKKALYEVFLDASEFNYGFASYNQDHVRVNAKHWLYALTAAPTAWTVAYPTVDDLWVFGPYFTDTGTPITAAGTCASPLDLSNADERARLNRMARGDLGGDGAELWFRDGGSTYRMTVALPAGVKSGDLVLSPVVTLDRFSGSCSASSFVTVGQEALAFRRVKDFLYMEAEGSGGGSSSGGLSTIERFGGYWSQTDAVADFDCGTNRPFSGKGWEGNYDNDDYEDAVTFAPVNASSLTGVDTADVDAIREHGKAYDLLFNPTYVRDEGRNVDRGDVLPFDWSDDYHAAFLKRLNPNHGTTSAADFGIASYFEDRVPAGENRSYLKLLDDSKRPLVATGGSPFAKAINDFRCWYSEKRSGQCKNARYPKAWELVARENIGNEAGCVQPYLILVTDAENTCGGESPVADVAGLNSQSNVKTWVIAIAPEGSASGQINAIPHAGKGTLIYVQNEDQLRAELAKIRGQIEEETRTFASAAVPTVQASVTDQIYVSNFIPVNGESVWPGTVLSFIKPLPLDADDRPDTSSDRLNWDAGSVLVKQDQGLGSAANQRRVYYAIERQDPAASEPAQEADGTPILAPVPVGLQSLKRSLLAPTPDPVGMDTATTAERDRWLGMGIPFALGDDTSEDAARTTANGVLDFTYAVKQADVEGVGTVDYLMGDVFHSDPVIVGTPVNVRYLAGSVPGYRNFFRKHKDRRKVLLVGSNDGMLHAFDAGRPHVVTRNTAAGNIDEIAFDNGTGKELFAYVPRPMLGELRKQSTSTDHSWGVDGSLRVADVNIDAAYSTQPDPDDREWRTVLVGGFRRGAPGYYALDITQPDPLKEVSVGLPARVSYIQTQDQVVPQCHNNPANPQLDSAHPDETDLDCGSELPYPAPLWEFGDTLWDENTHDFVALNEDGVGGADLGNSWSAANIGRIQICDGDDCMPSVDPDNPDDLVYRYVAVFGGGLPSAKQDWGQVGNWIYMVDVETGKTIYKRQVDGSVAAEVSAVDTDSDGTLDRVYFGTTAGFLYRIDLVEYDVDPDSGERTLRPYPKLEDTDVTDVDGNVYTVQRIPVASSDAEPKPVWQPRKIFDTLATKSTTDSNLVSRPIFMPVSVIFVGELGRYAVSFGTGDREDLWRPNGTDGRFYTFADDTDLLDEADLPINETGLRRVTLTDPNIDLQDPLVAEKNFLLDRPDPGTRGWVLELGYQDRLISNPFNLSGVTFFVTYSPRVETSGGECTREGDSKIFAVNTTNANGFLRDELKNRVRFIERKAFATQPFTEPSQTKNPVDGGGNTADDIDLGTHLQDVMEELKTLLPANCRFPGQRVDVKLLLDRTNVTFVAPVPVCLIESNWTELSP